MCANASLSKTTTKTNANSENHQPDDTESCNNHDELQNDDYTTRQGCGLLDMNYEDHVEEKGDTRPSNPLKEAPFLSRLCFSWAYKLLKLGLSRTIEEGDLPDLLEIDTSSQNLQLMQQLWSDAQRRGSRLKRRPNLHRAILCHFLRKLWWVQILKGFGCAARISQGIALGWLVESFTLEEELTDVNINGAAKNGYLLASVMILCGIVVIIEHHQVFFHTWRQGMQYRIASVAAIYDKAFRLSSTGGEGKAAITSGSVVNLATNDVERFLQAALWVNYLFWGPFEALLVLVVGLKLIGGAFAAGYILLILFVPLQYRRSQRFAKFRATIASTTDARVTLVAQAISGVRVMKLSGWEINFGERIAHARSVEMHKIQKANRLRALNEAMFFASNVVVAVVIFTVHVLTGGVLTSRAVFTTITLLNVVQMQFVKYFSMGAMAVSECAVSISRIQKFLEAPEMYIPSAALDQSKIVSSLKVDSSLDRHTNTPTVLPKGRPMISMSDVTCYWSPRQDKRESASKGTDAQIRDKTEIPVSEEKQTDGSTVLTCTGPSDPSLMGDKQIQLTLPYADNESPSQLQQDHLSISPAETREASTSERNNLALSKITMDFHSGVLYCVIGTVGSGKSALLQALVGELLPHSGTIEYHATNDNHPGISPTFAYASQDSWIMNGTVKENVVMGLPFRRDWYRQVIQASGLDVDISQQFQNGDRTIVGDRGVQCSGGQRARIGLARALYRDADVLLLDDPLSAVDSGVGRLIYTSAIRELGVQRGKCVVLATHQHHFVAHDDTSDKTVCLLMSRGRAVCVGSYSYCLAASNGQLTKANQHHTSGSQVITPTSPSVNGDETSDLAPEGIAPGKKNVSEQDEVKQDKLRDGEKAEHAEMNRKGQVEFSTYISYMKAMGGAKTVISLLLLFAATQSSVLALVIFIGEWSEMPPSEQDSGDTLGLILGLCSAAVVLAVIRAICTFFCTVRASQRLHDDMTRSVLRAKIEFFDTNPLGRILNRFSGDVGTNDDLLPHTIFDFMVCFFMVLGGVISTFIVMPLTLVAFPPLACYFVHIRRVFVVTTRELKRLEGMARSPIFAMLSEALTGMATIRGNDYVAYFRQKFEVAHDAHTRAFFSFIASSRWIGFRMDCIMLVSLAIASFAAVIVKEVSLFTINAAILGLALVTLVQLANTFQWTVRQSAEVVNQMVSVERLVSFIGLLPEADLITDEDAHRVGWPRQGSIEARNLSVRYRSTLPLSLSDVSFRIEGGMRVGVVGRTGSGKSTLIQALFRLLEAEKGGILVDGVDISSLGLHRLRTKMSVIPQTPVLFSGVSVRDNLDPFQVLDDETILNALCDVQMKDSITALAQGLNHMVAEGGSNFSVGQRQLLCLARAILRKSKILVLDEPTANVDARTDELLQAAISRVFAGATILAVAHRLDTIIEYDRVLVLGNGRMLEYGTPAELIAQRGDFASMVDSTGPSMSKVLRSKASTGIRKGQPSRLSEGTR